MKKYRMYKAKAKNENQECIKANQLDWRPTDMVYDFYDDAYVHKVNLQAIDEWYYYSIVEED